MKKLVLSLAAAFGTVGVSQLAMAQGYEYEADSKADLRFYISPMATYSLYDGTRSFDDGLGYHLSLGKILGRGANLELHGSFAEADGSPRGEDPAIDGELTSYGISVLLFQARQSFPLYGILSVAKGFAETPDGSMKAESDQFDAGLGYLLSLGNWPLIGEGAALRFEARYRLDKFAQSEAETYDGLFAVGNERSYHDGIIGIGLFLPLGADPNREIEPDEPKAVTQIVVSAPDSDGDQIPDDMDACPGTPPGAQIDVRGCERDSDKDGVVNSQDRCPGTPEGRQVDANGCPLDGDGDGVADGVDQCPNTPAGLSVLADGCALRGDCRVPNAGQRIDSRGCAVGAVVLKGVNFDTASADLTANARQILDTVAAALVGVDNIRIEVGGHTDSVGDAGYNQKLSERRARSVRSYLVENGVRGGILTARGYGEQQPIVSNESEAGREMNRRVELKVLED